MQPVASSSINAITARGVRRAGKGQQGGFLFALPLAMKTIFGRGVMDKMF